VKVLEGKLPIRWRWCLYAGDRRIPVIISVVLIIATVVIQADALPAHAALD